MITHLVGLSLGPSSSIESGVAVREVSSGRLIHVDKLFSMNDIQTFFNNYISLKNSIICVSLPWDNTMLEGKWRVLSKQYQLIHNNEKQFLNRDNWMQRFSARGSELLLSLSDETGTNSDNDSANKSVGNIFRFEVFLTRQKLNLYSNYKERSSADCKFLQGALKNEFGFSELPSNMMPVAQLEAIVGTILANEHLKGNTREIFNFKNLSVINVL